MLSFTLREEQSLNIDETYNQILQKTKALLGELLKTSFTICPHDIGSHLFMSILASNSVISLNIGATKARHDLLWFLHADSRVSAENIFALEQALKKYPNVLHYFDLAYDGGHLTDSSYFGANIRSRLLGLPYGDQGFCISKSHFNKIGGYLENVAYGEDLIFVRLAKRTGIKLNRIPSKLPTSERKYKQYGWLKLTVLRQWQMAKLFRMKL